MQLLPPESSLLFIVVSSSSILGKPLGGSKISYRPAFQSSTNNLHCPSVNPVNFDSEGSLKRASNVFGIGSPFSKLGRLGSAKKPAVDRVPASMYQRCGNESNKSLLWEAIEKLHLPQNRSVPHGWIGGASQ
jgi:hypothetical protein